MPVDGGAGNTEFVGYLLDRLVARVVHLFGDTRLPWRELGFLAPGSATFARCSQPGDRSLRNESVFKLRDRRQDLEEHPAHRCRGVDALVEDDQVHTFGLQCCGEGEEVFHRAAESVEFGDDELVAIARGDQCLVQFSPVREFS